MELLYNPEQMDAAELRHTFVGREGLIEELLSLIEHQPDGPGVQHAVIIGPRGMGKTTLLLMVRLLLAERGLADRWLALKFPEECWGTSDTGDLWCETLVRIAAVTGDIDLRSKAVGLRESAKPGDDIADAALAQVRDWSQRSGKRLLLLLENLDQLFEQFSDTQELVRLRDMLRNEGCMMLLGSATRNLDEPKTYEQPFQEFFTIYNLYDLELENIKSLLARRAGWDGIENLEARLAAETQWLKAMRHFTGGNPRLVLMLYRVITLTDIGEVHQALTKLLDEITPYYQAKTQALPPQQRKILDYLARSASKTYEGLTPRQIAEGTRLPPNQVSSQLRRLGEAGYVATSALRGRNTYYSLAEPLYSLWYQMRFASDGRRRSESLLAFLELWYAVEEILENSKAMDARLGLSGAAGGFAKAREQQEPGRHATKAPRTTRHMPAAPAPVPHGAADPGGRQNPDAAGVPTKLAAHELRAGRSTQALADLDSALAAEPANTEARVNRAKALIGLKQYADALDDLNLALESEPTNPGWLVQKARALGYSGRFQQALEVLDRVIARHGRSTDPSMVEQMARALCDKGMTLARMGRGEEAIWEYDLIVARFGDHTEPPIRELVALAMFNKGVTLGQLARSEDAIAAYDAVLEQFGEPSETALREQVARAMVHKGATLGQLGRVEDEVEVYDHLIARFDEASEMALQEQVGRALFHKGAALARHGRIEAAISVYSWMVERFGEVSETKARDGLAQALAAKALTLAASPDPDRLRLAWTALQRVTALSSVEDWEPVLLFVLLCVAGTGQVGLARQMIAESALDAHLVPLARALDYVISGNPEYIEKLTPELRTVVVEIVDKLPKPKDQSTTGQPAHKLKRPKRRARSRSRRNLC